MSRKWETARYQNQAEEEISDGADSDTRDKVKHNERSDHLFS